MKHANLITPILVVFAVCFILCHPLPIFAADDDTPFFAGGTASPNVMIIFDNSNSMQDSPYKRDDGITTYTPNWQTWRRGVKIDDDCNNDGTADDPCILDSTPGVPDAAATISYNETKHITQSTYVTLPGKNAPNLPGLVAPSSTVTTIRDTGTACSVGMECDNRIYDSSVTWGTLTSTIMNSTFKYWRVEIKDETDGTIQIRNLDSYNASGYWTVYGNYIEYNPGHSYRYTLLTGAPGEVTYKGDTNRVYDRNYDWSLLTSSIWSTEYNNHIIEIYAGANAGSRGRLTGRETTYGYWSVSWDVAPAVACDDTSRYRIIGVADDNKATSGGNHPDSKMYQAKLALQKFLDSDSIKTCDKDVFGNCIAGTTRYLMNVGFATYMQSIIPATTAQYYRKRAGATTHTDPYFRYYYRYKSDADETYYNNTGCSAGNPVLPTSFIYTPDSSTQTGVTVGYEFDRLYRSGQCDEQTIRYRATEIACSPTDSYPDRLRIRVQSKTSYTGTPAGTDPAGNPQWGYTSYGWRNYADNGTHDCTTYTPPSPDGGGTRVLSSEDCYQACQSIAATDTTTGTYYETYWKSVDGDLRRVDPAKPGFITKIPAVTDTYTVRPYYGECGGSWQNCVAPDPENTSGDGYSDWTLVPVGGLTNVPIDSVGTLGNISRIIYDSSTFFNPGYDASLVATGSPPVFGVTDPNRVHGWSYKRTVNNNTSNVKDDNNVKITDDNYIFLYSWSYMSKWPDALQRSPYFPSVAGDPLSRFSNYNGDDQTAFVDLPVVVPAADDKGDDRSGLNVGKIKNLIGLSRIVHPRYSDYVLTMAPISSGSLSVNTSESYGQGTPLAASLTDAKKYYESYIAQDQFTQGGCRDNYIILLTDGLETAGGDPSTAALALANLTYNTESTPVKVYVIGFGMDSAAQATLNDIANKGGTTKAYFANDVDTLVGILAHDITSDILSGSYGRSKAALTPAGITTQQDLSLYYAYFDYPKWAGHLEAWNLDPETGDIKCKAPYWASNCAGTVNAADAGKADAGCIMAEDFIDAGTSPGGPGTRRTLYTTVAGARTEFAPANVAGIKPLVNPANLDINGDLSPGDDQDAKDIINFVHHPGYDTDRYTGNRNPDSPLADIYNSGPVIVSAPAQGECADHDNNSATSEIWADMPGYCAHKETHKNRESIVYVGTNGGMIEAIVAGAPAITAPATPEVSGGYEKWGYIPSAVLGKLNEFKDGHRFTMDLSIQAGEVDTSDNLAGTGWKTILIAGQRKGGSSYTALDITDPDNPQPMWEFTDSNLGQSWSIPSFGRIAINGVKTSVVFFGGGYSTNADVGNRLFIVRARDGVLIKEFTVGASTNNVPGGLRTMRYLTNNVGTVVDYRTNLAKLPDGTVVDYSDRKNFIEVLYFGDTSGTMWRLSNLNTFSAASTADPFGPPWSDNVELTALYIPDNDKKMPIYYRPAVHDIKKGSIDTGVMAGCVKRYLLAGTGDEQNPTTSKDGTGKPVINYFFEIEDREFDISKDDTSHVPAWTAQEKTDGKFRLNWRFHLGLQLPHDKYGFMLDNSGVRIQKGGKDILNLHTYILPWSEFSSDGWSIVDGALYNNASKKIANVGGFVIKHDTGSPKNDNGLYNNNAGTELAAADGTYIIRDFSLWLTDENGCFFDSDGTCLVDTDNYTFDNNGMLLTGSSNQLGSIITDFGEKVLSEPAAQAGNVFFTTYTPEGGCAMGSSYFYGLEISNCKRRGGDGVLEYDKFNEKNIPFPKRRIGLGLGITPGVTIGGPKAYVPVFSGGVPEINPITIPSGNAALLYWRQ
jgi:hypothetical protein